MAQGQKKEKFISFRSDGLFKAYVAKIAAALSYQLGRNIKETDVIWMFIDAGRPELEQELSDFMCDNVAQKMKQQVNIAAGMRHLRLAEGFLRQGVESTTEGQHISETV